MGNRATFQVKGCEIVLYSHWGGDISWVIDTLKEYVTQQRARGGVPDHRSRPDPDHLILIAAKQPIWDRIWAPDVPPVVGDWGHFLLSIQDENAPVETWTLERVADAEPANCSGRR